MVGVPCLVAGLSGPHSRMVWPMPRVLSQPMKRGPAKRDKRRAIIPAASTRAKPTHPSFRTALLFFSPRAQASSPAKPSPTPHLQEPKLKATPSNPSQDHPCPYYAHALRNARRLNYRLQVQSLIQNPPAWVQNSPRHSKVSPPLPSAHTARPHGDTTLTQAPVPACPPIQQLPVHPARQPAPQDHQVQPPSRPGSMRGGQGWRYFGVPGTILNPCWRVLDQRLNLESIVQPASIPECMHILWTWLILRRV